MSVLEHWERDLLNHLQNPQGEPKKPPLGGHKPSNSMSKHHSKLQALNPDEEEVPETLYEWSVQGLETKQRGK